MCQTGKAEELCISLFITWDTLMLDEVCLHFIPLLCISSPSF